MSYSAFSSGPKADEEIPISVPVASRISVSLIYFLTASPSLSRIWGAVMGYPLIENGFIADRNVA